MTIAHCALGASLAASEQWLARPDRDLAALLYDAFGALANGFQEP